MNKSQNCNIFITTCNWSFFCNWRSTRNYI